MSFENDVLNILSKLEHRDRKMEGLQDTIHGVISNLLHRLQGKGVKVHLDRDQTLVPNTWIVTVADYRFKVDGAGASAAIESGVELEHYLSEKIKEGLNGK